MPPSGTPNGLAKAAFRAHLPDLSTPRFTTAKKQDAYEYAAAFKEHRNPPWLYDLTVVWEGLLGEEFRGITADGNVIPNLFHEQDENVPIKNIVSATNTLLDKLDAAQKEKLLYPMNSKAWRAWSNPEFLLRPLGLRLEEVSEDIASSILRVMETTLSPEGYAKALGAMRTNHFLGQLCDIPRIMNKYSYNFLLFGTPSETEAWGWSLYGHHLCLSVFLKGAQIVISPTFTGAEPNVIDEGEFAGTQILKAEGELGLKLMRSLSEEQRARAVVFEALKDEGMCVTGDLVTDRWNRDDQRHLCGAFRDNRVVPVEGVRVGEFSEEAREIVMGIAEEFLMYLPETARRMRMELIRGYFDQTWFSWIGGYGDVDAFYYRIQSPVVILEFDHHSGVFLTNEKPAKFHIHTIVRTPNAGDYGHALRKPEERIP